MNQVLITNDEENPITTFDVGDFLVSFWGYDQTNVNYFKVIKKTATAVTLQEWEQEIVKGKDAGYLAEYVKVGYGPKVGHDGQGNYGALKPFRRKLKVATDMGWRDGKKISYEYVKIKSWGMYATKADPNAEHLQTHYH
jgi:hypothetical protein